MSAASATTFRERLRDAGARFRSPAGGGAASDVPLPERIADFGDPARELAHLETAPVACPLLDWAPIAVTGPDASAFLQGQLTNDVATLTTGAAQWSAWCSPKGRVLATFPLARTGPEAFALIVPAALGASLVRRLRMYVLRSKVVVAPLADTHVAIGTNAAGAALDDRTGDSGDGAVVSFLYPDGRRVVAVPHGDAAAWWDRLARDAVPVGAPAWDLLGIRGGVAVITLETADRFVPQMLNWELVGGVSFRKGCYPGQEIVARMQYRGRIKERLYRARIASDAVAPGAPLYGARFGEQACGTVVNAVSLPGQGSELLAVLQTASAEGDRIALVPDGGEPLVLLDLPYAMPAASEPVAG